jgi:hypothetical protein
VRRSRPEPLRPLDTVPRWGEVGIHGIARPREWDAVVTADASLEGSAAAFVALPDGRLVVDDGPADPSPLAAAVDRSLERPYRAEGVRRGATTWAVAARRIRVLELPGVAGDEIRLSVTPEGRQLQIDGLPELGGLALVERLLEGDGVVTASRLEGELWEVRLDRL